MTSFKAYLVETIVWKVDQYAATGPLSAHEDFLYIVGQQGARKVLEIALCDTKYPDTMVFI